MKKLNLLFSALFVSALSSVSAASNIGPAGCGLGNLFLGKDNQVIAATTNGTGTQTFGITSGTSNCIDAATNTAMLNQFVDVNKVALAKDAARGEGETIASLARMMGCRDQQVLGASLKDNYGQVFPSENTESATVSGEIRRLVHTEPELISQCSPRS